MPLPKQSEVEVPLLEALVELGGQGKPRELYPLVTNRFSAISEDDLLSVLPSGGNRWTNRIQWVRQRLVTKGEMCSPGHGLWGITEKGKQRLSKKRKSGPQAPTGGAQNLQEIYEDYVRIPEHVDHPFRSMSTTHSGPCRPPIPEHAVHLIGASNDAG